MISSIIVKNVASYEANNGVEIADLKKVNFFFGFNGSGKSTIARYLRDLGLDENSRSTGFGECTNDGFDSGQNEILVFNDDFIAENFIHNSELKGVFSLNQSNADIDRQISEEEANIERYNEEIDKLKDRLSSINSDADTGKRSLINHCWTQRNTFSGFSKLILKHSGSRTNHIQEIWNRLEKLPDQIATIQQLSERYNRLYEEDLEQVGITIDAGTYHKIRRLESKIDNVLQEVIVGNEDVDIASLIGTLNSRKWVEDGREFLEKTGSTCPFCQQPTIDEELKSQFDRMFDLTYKQKLSEIRTHRDQYLQLSKEFLLKISSIQDVFNPSNEVTNLILGLRSFFDRNLGILESKLSRANEKMSIDSLSSFKEQLSLVIRGIKANNELVEHSGSIKDMLEQDIWNFMSRNCRDEIKNYDKRIIKYTRLRNLISELENRTREKIDSSSENIEVLRDQTVNTRKAVDNINTILRNAGFEGFEIDEKDTVNNITRYYLKRPNDSNSEGVFETLSEGEKNFIAFLYFHQRCLGTDDLEVNAGKKKILVIDDPVSSLDSQALFIITTLIRQLIKRKAEEPKAEKKELFNSNIEQIFVLTHNFYFYKEVSLSKRLICTDFWHFKVSKTSNITKIVGDYTNRIKDDYSLLWSTLKQIKGDNRATSNQNILISNTMRRVIETYVNFLGISGGSWSAILNEDEEAPGYYMKSAFISTINDESHGVTALDSIYYQKIINEEPQALFNVFAEIFRVIGKEHYEMMMDEELTD